MRRRAAFASLLLVIAAAWPATARAARIDQRTVLLSAAPDGTVTAGARGPAVSDDGRTVVFDSVAGDLVADDANGAVRDVFAADGSGGGFRLVSKSALGLPADGPSFDADVSADGRTVVFSSLAGNLAAPDVTGRTDVFASVDGGRVFRITNTPGGAEADGDSASPRVSGDGRYAVFASSASNLVAGDTNGVADVFRVRLADRRIERVSTGRRGAAPDGPSGRPAISADGRFVTFSSTASNLVGGDTNGVADVFLADVHSGVIRRMSVSSGGRQQTRTTGSPGGHSSSISADGRYVAFSSRATNLVGQDSNRAEDVFLRDRVRRRTRRMSVTLAGAQGDGASTAPQISADGRYIAFPSLAGNLAVDGGPGEDIVVFDRVLRAPVTGSVAAGRSSTSPSISRNGTKLVFTSAGGAFPGDQVFLRHLDPPDGTFTRVPTAAVLPWRPGLAVATDEPASDRALCKVTGTRLRPCALKEPRLPRSIRLGFRLVAVHAGGAGMLFDPKPPAAVLRLDPVGPAIAISRRVRSLLRRGRIAGTTRDFAGVAAVEVAVGYTAGTYCVAFTRRGAERSPCRRRVFLRARGTRRWSVALGGRVPAGAVAGYVIRARDRLGLTTTVSGALVVGRGR